MSEPVTAERIARDKATCDAMQNYPTWRIERDEYADHPRIEMRPPVSDWGPLDHHVMGDYLIGGWLTEAEARFIAAARSGWPEALAEIERLRGALDDALYWWHRHLDYTNPESAELDNYRRIHASLNGGAS